MAGPGSPQAGRAYNPPAAEAAHWNTVLTTQAQVIKTQIPNPAPTPEALLIQVHLALEEMKAKDTIEIDERGKTSIADYLVVASGTSTRHV